MSAISKGSSGGGAHRNSESGTAAGWNGSTDAFEPSDYAADTLGEPPRTITASAILSSTNKNNNTNNNGTQYGSRALVKTSPTTTAAVATTYPSAQLRQSPFSGLYDDVDFPVHTLFTPPRPPGEMLPRARRPNRTKPVTYANDVARAGAREHAAQREVSRVWRGVLCRRRLRQARAMDTTLNEKARVIQCWWRQLQARWRRRQLATLRSAWAKERTAQYVAARVVNTTNVLYWQHGRYEGAALRIQRAVRWYLRELQRRRCAEAGLPLSAWPPALQRPTAESHKPYFPWRHRKPEPRHAAPPVKSGALIEVESAAAALSAKDALEEASAAAPARRTLLQFRDTPQEVLPPTQDEVEKINAEMRVREARRSAALQSPEAASRNAWKTEGLRQEDLDFNAGVLQRLYRSKKAPETAHTKELTAAYFNKAARTIARTFRMYVLIKRMRAHRLGTSSAVQEKIAQRSAAKVAELKTEAVWQKDLMDAAATSIQRCWAWHRYRCSGVVPPAYAACHAVPSPPCYGLIQAHIERERALRWSTMNLLEQRQYEDKRQHKYLRYVPKTVNIYEHTGFLFVQAAPEASAKRESEL